MAKKICRPEEIQARTGLRSSAMHEAVANELLPRLFKVLGGRASGCLEHELDEVLDARAAGATDEEVRAIVRRQIARRQTRLAELRAG